MSQHYNSSKLLPLPLVHLNGTSLNALIEQNMAVYSALVEAQATLCKNPPHARDYYPISNTAFNDARDLHQLRAKQLDIMIKDYLATLEYLNNLKTDQEIAQYMGD